MPKTAGLPILAGLTLLTASPSRSQAPSSFGSSAEIVVVDLTATDAQGRLVTDLRPDEIELYEDGKRQHLDLMRLVARPRIGDNVVAPAGPRAGPPADAAPAVSGSPSAPMGTDDDGASRLVVVVDLASLPPELVSRARESIQAYARRELEPGTLLMLVTLDRGLQLRLPFTDDAERFATAVEGLHPRLSPDDTLEALVGEVGRACELPHGRPAALGLARAWVERARQALELSMQSLATLARHLGTLPGRKQVVLFSAGYSTDPGAVASQIVSQACGGGPGGLPGREVDAGLLLRLVADEANRARVSVYTVDVRGLMGDIPPASVSVRGGGAGIQSLQAVIRQVQREGKDCLSSIAEETGAAAFVSTNDPGRALRAAALDARSYYLLGYVPPPGRKEGHSYRVDVKVARRGVSLRHRRGYEWLSEAKRAERALGAAFLFPSLYANEGLALETQVRDGRLDVTVSIPTSVLAFRIEGAEYRNEITLYALLRDAEGRPVGRHYLFTKTVTFKLAAAGYEGLRARDNVVITSEAGLPAKGRFHLWVAVRHSGGRIAVADARLDAL